MTLIFIAVRKLSGAVQPTGFPYESPYNRDGEVCGGSSDCWRSTVKFDPGAGGEKVIPCPAHVISKT